MGPEPFGPGPTAFPQGEPAAEPGDPPTRAARPGIVILSDSLAIDRRGRLIDITGLVAVRMIGKTRSWIVPLDSVEGGTESVLLDLGGDGCDTNGEGGGGGGDGPQGGGGEPMGGDIQVLAFDGDTIICCEGEFEELIEGECECPTYLVRDEEGDCACENGGSPENFCMGDPWWSDDPEEPCPGECFLVDDWHAGPRWVCPSNCEDPDPPGGGSSGTCGDERDVIIAEYQQFPVNLLPGCNDFASSGGTAHFTWAELNGGWSQGNLHPTWGMVKPSLTTGLEGTRSQYGKPIVIRSGYRCPHGNGGIPGAHSNSAHMHGTAADFRSVLSHWDWQECLDLRSSADLSGPQALSECSAYGGNAATQQVGSHLHAQW